MASLRSEISSSIRAIIPKSGLRYYLRITTFIKCAINFFNLDSIAFHNKTDKIGRHTYTPHYHRHFKAKRFKRIRLLEIGIGGYKNPEEGGGSLRMWRTYFPFGKIYGLDIYDKSPHNEKRIKTIKGSQVDNELLKEVNLKYGPFDLIIDDGSHINEHVLQTFNILFPFLKENGIYVIEDTQTSYLKEYGGSINLNDEKLMNTYFSKFGHTINHAEIANYNASYFDLNILSIEFIHNMIFIHKGDNSKKSWIVKK